LSQGAILRSIVLGVSLLAFAPAAVPQNEVPSDEVTRETLIFTRIYGAIADNYMDARSRHL
jgi:hypothetical protein